jgi:SAM-dependent methyltransferase
MLNKKRNFFLNIPTDQIFSKIYIEKMWCPDDQKSNHQFYSGIGSHNAEFVKDYTDSVNLFLKRFPSKPNVVDLGCGDFTVGAILRKSCNKYIAVDIFDKLINRNKIIYKHLNVDFKTIDITKDNLPSADICFLRQVLQHLSNDLIINFLNLAKKKYKYFIITEHLPSKKDFIPNIDIPTGPFIRLDKDSGVILTKEPFNLPVKYEENICNIYPKSIKNFEGIINTKVLQLY